MPLIKRNIVRILFAIGVILTLIGCHPRPNLSSRDSNDLPKKVKGASDKKIVSLQAQLNKQNIKVISIGQNYLISIPSAKIFADQSPRLTWQSYQVLNEVVEYVKQFRTVSLHVRSFSSQYVSARRELALTAARAKAVGDYIQSQGVDTRFIFTSGLGSDKPIMAYKQGGDFSGNSRVEISFRRQVA